VDQEPVAVAGTGGGQHHGAVVGDHPHVGQGHRVEQSVEQGAILRRLLGKPGHVRAPHDGILAAVRRQPGWTRTAAVHAAKPGGYDSRVKPHLGAAAHTVSEQVVDVVAEVVAEVRPRMRGWLHAATVPLALVGGVLLVLLSPAGEARVGSAVFVGSALLLFTVSATMHRGGWSTRTEVVLTRLDHASIFVLIAGSYTPFSLLLLDGGDRVALLSVAWGGAALGIAFRLFVPRAPRWVYTPVYIALGWASVFFAADFLRYPGTPVVVLLGLGGVLYTVGAVVYGLRRPNPLPQWFGYHEVFHALTVVAFAAHYAGVSIAAYSLR
jgi:hemolysin III